MMRVIMHNFFMLCVTIKSTMLSVIMLDIIMLNVMAPLKLRCINFFGITLFPLMVFTHRDPIQ